MSAKPILAWKFIWADHRLRYADKRELRAGETLRDPRDRYGRPTATPILLQNGFHASVSARDALRCADYKMTHVARVEIGGVVVQGDDKLTGTEIRCLWIADAEKALRLFAINCRKRRMIHDFLGGSEPPLAALWALDCAERFMRGDADVDELAAAADTAAAAHVTADVGYAAYGAAMAAHYAAAAYAAYAAEAAAYIAGVVERKMAANELEQALLALAPRGRS
jgi:hypothetical protein